MSAENSIRPSQHRSELLVGPEVVRRLTRARVILFGVGGVGSWCAEGLLRSGVRRLTLVDSDQICVTNLNRQLQTTAGNVGKVKVLELARRLREIDPEAEIEALQTIYDEATRDSFKLDEYDYVIDAIDSLSNKIFLIMHALGSGTTVYSAMGASSQLDPTRVRTGSIWKTERCPLAKKVRKRLRRHDFHEDFVCVYSDEAVTNYQALAGGADGGGATVEAFEGTRCGGASCFCPQRVDEEDALGAGEPHEWCSSKAVINGSMVHVTATFGMVLAGLVVQDVVAQVRNAQEE